MAVLAVVDEAGLERGLDARDDGLVDVALALLAPFDLGLEVEQLLAVDDRQAPLFRLRRVDQHAFHVHSLRAAALRRARARTRRADLRRATVIDAREDAEEPEGIALDCGAACRSAIGTRGQRWRVRGSGRGARMPAAQAAGAPAQRHGRAGAGRARRARGRVGGGRGRHPLESLDAGGSVGARGVGASGSCLPPGNLVCWVRSSFALPHRAAGRRVTWGRARRAQRGVASPCGRTLTLAADRSRLRGARG